MIPSFWPHIWAIPIVLVVGFLVGWAARGASNSAGSGAGEDRSSGGGPDSRLFDD